MSVTNEDLNKILEKLRKAHARCRSIELVLRAAEAEYKVGGMEKEIYFATKRAIPALRQFLQAAYDEEGRIETLYTEQAGLMAVEVYQEMRKARRAASKVVERAPVRAKVDEEEPLQKPVRRRNYNNTSH